MPVATQFGSRAALDDAAAAACKTGCYQALRVRTNNLTNFCPKGAGEYQAFSRRFEKLRNCNSSIIRFLNGVMPTNSFRPLVYLAILQNATGRPCRGSGFVLLTLNGLSNSRLFRSGHAPVQEPAAVSLCSHRGFERVHSRTSARRRIPSRMSCSRRGAYPRTMPVRFGG